MTAATLDSPTVARPGSTSWATRIPAAFRLQFIVPTNLIIVPTMVFLVVWAASIGIAMWIHAAADDRIASAEPMYGGASQAAVWTLGFMAAHTVTHTMPFAMALSFSRRTFVVGTYLAFAAVSVGYGMASPLAAWIERVTNGFGIHAYQFDTPFMTSSHGIPGGGLLAGALTLAVMIATFMLAAVLRRTSVLTFWALLVAVFALLAVVVLLIVQNVGWSGIGDWFLQQTALTGTAYCLGFAVVTGMLGYAILRRDTTSAA